ncbi:hypothetical protein F7725_027984 [Dissostichus mawsoni]|uniref:MYND-type domain-containing protein n=1 Tax=Dissostichus mawsoni TaxID=36200 RepID=A0A7J5XEF4_DISMA|nr:hypothetical protein F7725_027984 [Dissostichus mawsoni]
MQAHIQKHRLQAENVGWDVAAVLSLNRDSSGPKGPLEVSSELLIQHSSRGDLQAMSQVLQTGLVHPDVADSQGHTALIAATVNCHNDVIQLLLDMGADIDKINCEGMSALAVCHVLYYPFQSLHNTLVEPPAKTQVSRSASACGSSPQISQVDFLTDTPRAEELTEHILHHSSNVSNSSELITECWPGLDEPETDTEHLKEERKEKEGEEREDTEREGREREREEMSRREDENESKGEEREIESRCGQTWGNEESELEAKEREFKKREEDVGLGERRETEARDENIEEDLEEEVRSNHEEDIKEEGERGSEDMAGVERSIHVMDGGIALGSVQWTEHRAGRVQHVKDREVTPTPTFDSACSVSSFRIQVTEEAMQHSAEALSRTGVPQSSDTQETVRKMAAMKTESVLFPLRLLLPMLFVLFNTVYVYLNRHRVRLNILKLLLERGADPNTSRVPMPVLFLAIMASDTEAVRRLLLCGARTDIPLPPKRKGLYPLHVAAALPGPAGPRITELLLHAITDPDAQACDQSEIYEPDKIFQKAKEALSSSEGPHLKEGGRTALHVACQRDADYRAVEELLKGGADPNIPLGRRVGSALCALANIKYHLGGNRAKLLEMLAQAGADILMPVMVGDVVGTADLRIANTPFHALSMRERETFKARRQLLSMMGDLLRQTAAQREIEQHHTTNITSSTERFVHTGAGPSNGPLPSCESIPPTTFCYHCGRSVSVKLTACSRCHNVFYCSRNCKLKAWDERHKEECIRVSASANGFQKSVVLKSPRGPRPLTAMLKSKTVPRPLSLKLKSHRVSKPLSMAEKVLESQVNLKENYSCN